MTDIDKARNELIDTLDTLDINQLLKVKIMLYIYKSLENEEVLSENCKILDLHRRKYDSKRNV